MENNAMRRAAARVFEKKKFLFLDVLKSPGTTHTVARCEKLNFSVAKK